MILDEIKTMREQYNQQAECGRECRFKWEGMLINLHESRLTVPYWNLVHNIK